MRRFLKATTLSLVSLMLGAALASSPAVASRGMWLRFDRDVFEASMERVDRRLEQAQSQLRGMRNRRARRALANLEAVETELAGLRRNAGVQKPGRGRTRSPYRTEAMSSGDFAALRVAVRRAPFGSDKVDVVQDVAGYTYVTTQQVIDLMALMPFSEQKVETALILHPRVIDPQNFFQVYSRLPFESDRRTLRARLRSH